MPDTNEMTLELRRPAKGTIGRLQFTCRMTLHFALCVYFIVGACVITFHLATAIFSLGQDGSEITSIACLFYVCMIITALVCIHDCVIEMRRQVRLVRLGR